MATYRVYKGEVIRDCERAPGQHRGKWIVQTYHETGMMWSDEICPHFRTVAEAKEYIRDEKGD